MDWGNAGFRGLDRVRQLSPRQPDNLCQLFRGEEDWYEAAVATREKWGVPIQILMAIMRQESSLKRMHSHRWSTFVDISHWARQRCLRLCSGKEGCLGEYVEETGNWFADRDDFSDAIDFIGWYMDKTSQVNKVSKWDAYHQYLNYHEGRGDTSGKVTRKILVDAGGEKGGQTGQTVWRTVLAM